MWGVGLWLPLTVTIAGAASLHQAEDRNKQSQAVSEEDGKSIALSV